MSEEQAPYGSSDAEKAEIKDRYTKQIQQLESTAKQWNELMLGQFFTLRRLSKMVRISETKAREMISLMSLQCLVKFRQQQGFEAELKFVLDPTERLNGIDETERHLTEKYSMEIGHLAILREHVLLAIPEDKRSEAGLKVVN